MKRPRRMTVRPTASSDHFHELELPARHTRDEISAISAGMKPMCSISTPKMTRRERQDDQRAQRPVALDGLGLRTPWMTTRSPHEQMTLSTIGK